ncbi:PaaI family thioesterase [Aurantiacibacter luteus]|uniref:Thioesterase domain-containing protein n=1 Tax=Aurantiacibacter luteus TaxID=1581420 RepID=A0A0G9MXA9_9SPHN|nr:PaaI family thioesterase [Aurantiacibacter luteus]KLE33908.1 hypothetical protein AAW00_12655 [Aurantiacibacter luteus]
MTDQPLTPFWPSAKTLGARFVGMDEATKTMEMAFDPPEGFANMRGHVQGGLLAGFMDEAMGAAVYLGTGGRLQLTLDINLSLLAPVALAPVTVKARPVKSGRRITFVEAELFDHEGQLCARATGTAMATEWPGQKDTGKGEQADG